MLSMSNILEKLSLFLTLFQGVFLLLEAFSKKFISIKFIEFLLLPEAGFIGLSPVSKLYRWNWFLYFSRWLREVFAYVLFG